MSPPVSIEPAEERIEALQVAVNADFYVDARFPYLPSSDWVG